MKKYKQDSINRKQCIDRSIRLACQCYNNNWYAHGLTMLKAATEHLGYLINNGKGDLTFLDKVIKNIEFNYNKQNYKLKHYYQTYYIDRHWVIHGKCDGEGLQDHSKLNEIDAKLTTSEEYFLMHALGVAFTYKNIFNHLSKDLEKLTSKAIAKHNKVYNKKFKTTLLD